jgi:hypothetical protein
VCTLLGSVLDHEPEDIISLGASVNLTGRKTEKLVVGILSSP